jgi:hypothetical protein
MSRGVSKETAADRLYRLAGFDPSNASLIACMYTPSSELRERIKAVEKLRGRKKKLTKGERQQLGYQLEEMVMLAFQNITGASTLKSYQSAAAQHDYLIDGDDTAWQWFRKAIFIHGTDEGSGLLVEAKATVKAVGDREFQRLGNIITHYFPRTVGMGIFVTINGASGFPKRGGPRKKGLHSARLTQTVLYHSRKKPIVVLDWEDLKALTTAGSLVRILASKVREIEQLSGRANEMPDEPQQVDLPERLRALLRLNARRV